MANVTYTVQNKNGSYDGDMVVKQYTSLTINSGDTVTVDQPCRGLFILVNGDCTINGTLSMTARGAYANPTSSGASDSNPVDGSGLRFPFLTASGSDSLTASSSLLNGCGTEARSVISNFADISSDGNTLNVTRDGNIGGAGRYASGSSMVSGLPGGSSLNSTGGGGSGTAYYGGTTSRAGAKGSCFSGGSGSGACRGYSSGFTNGSYPVDYGGAGGNGGYNAPWGNVSGGGAGNPGGSSGSTAYSTYGENGTGGLIILVVKGILTIGSSGSIQAHGAAGGQDGGATLYAGSSGGGRIIVAHKGALSNNGTISALGGHATSPIASKPGGDGGVGGTTIQQIS